jgi:hypothetical protein
MLNALYFPALRPDPAWSAAITTLVDRLVCYGAVEESEGVPGCEVRIVAPLGPERQRFLALLREMTGRDAEYFKGQLMAAASIPGRDRDEASGWSLTAALQRSNAGAEAAELERSRNERLWQARLILELAAKISAAEAEIHLELAAASRKQKALLRALQGEGDEEEEITPFSIPSGGPGPRTFRVRDLLGAWAVLFTEDRLPEAFLVTDDREAGELLLEQVERLAPGAGRRLPDLHLPGPAGSGGRGAAGEIERRQLAATLSAILVRGGNAAEIGLDDAIEAWNGRLSGAGNHHPSLHLYLLPASPFRQALGVLSGLKEAGGGAIAGMHPLVLLGIAAA